MAMISVTDLKNGVTFEDEGQLYRVLSYEHIKMGRGSANIKVKARNLRSGATIEKSFINGARVQDAPLNRRQLQYLYKDGTTAYFMDGASFEQIEIPEAKLGTDTQYLKDGETYAVLFYNEEALAIDLPPKMEFTISETGPNVKGNSASNMYKDAILNNGMKVRVPLFMETGENVLVDTRTGEYSERATKGSY